MTWALSLCWAHTNRLLGSSAALREISELNINKWLTRGHMESELARKFCEKVQDVEK